VKDYAGSDILAQVVLNRFSAGTHEGSLSVASSKTVLTAPGNTFSSSSSGPSSCLVDEGNVCPATLTAPYLPAALPF
jgi:hypothetical protein